MIAVEDSSPGSAWIAATRRLLDESSDGRGKAHHLAVGFPAVETAPAMVAVVDRFLCGIGEPSASTVANTIFPSALYRPDDAISPRDHLYQMHEVKMRFHRRRRSAEKETYFSRLTGTDGTNTDVGVVAVNQLEDLIVRMKRQTEVPNPKSSMYELAVSDAAGDLRVQRLDQDHSIMGFPCLSHVSVTLVSGVVHLTAQYRNQHFIRKALGNYIGLTRLCRFIAVEVGVGAGEVLCVAAHADAEVGAGLGGKRRFLELLSECEGKLDVGARAGAA